MYDNSSSISMTSSSCCPRRPQETAPPPTTTIRHPDGQPLVSPGHHLTKVLTNFSIDSIIGARLESPPRPEDDNARAASPNHPSQPQKKFRPKNFACPVCRMAFSNNGQLKNHVRIHTGERPFECNQVGCNKTFTRNEELTRHKLIHTGVRPHACPSCCKSFGRKDHLKKHVRTHERKRMRKRVYVPATPLRPIAKSSVTGDGSGKTLIDQVYSSSKRMNSNSKSDARSLPKSAMTQRSLPPVTNGAAQFPRTAAVLPLPIAGSLAIDGYKQFNATFMPPPPVTLAQNFNHLIEVSDPARAMASLAVTNSLSLCQSPASMAVPASTGAALQQLAGDYWHKWYSFLGLCHQQQQEQQQQTITSSKRM